MFGFFVVLEDREFSSGRIFFTNASLSLRRLIKLFGLVAW